MPVHFFTEDTSPPELEEQSVAAWIVQVIEKHQRQCGELNIIFTSDACLLELNRRHLGHDYYTDILTFDQSEDRKTIEGDIFISVDRVRENGENLEIEWLEELHRVIIHGVLHLLGWSDATETDRDSMRKKEEECLSLRPY